MKQFDVFLCYHGPDRPAVRRFAASLRERGLEPWLDEEQLQPGLPWQLELERQILAIRAAAVFVGPSGFGPWHRTELDAYLRKFQEMQCPVIPVLLPEAGEAPELPLFLELRTWVDFRNKDPEDPQAIARLVWGITGSNPLRAASVVNSSTDALTRWHEHTAGESEMLFEDFTQHNGAAILEHVYVELELATGKAVSSELSYELSGSDPARRMNIRQVLNLKIFPRSHRWVILGDPGSGKTTLLRHLALSLAREVDPKWTPIFVSLPRFLQTRAENFFDAIDHEFHAALELPRNALETTLQSRVRKGRLLVLFDGLDEVPQDQRDQAKSFLKAFGDRWPQSPIIVTSRPIGMERLSGKYRNLRLLPFEREQKVQFLASWFGLGESQDWSAAEIAVQQIEAMPTLTDLASNPLYLTLMAMLLENEGERGLPERRTRLYDRIFDFLLDGKQRRPQSPIPRRAAVHETLRHLAEGMTRDNVDRESVAKLEDRVWDLEVRCKLQAVDCWKQNLRSFLDDVARCTGILGPHDGRSEDWRFWHRTFKEALTAERLEQIFLAEGEDRVIELADRIRGDEGRWAEPFALLVGRLEKPDNLLRRLTQANQALGVRALGTAQGLREETFTAVLDLTPDWRTRCLVYRKIPLLFGGGDSSALSPEDGVTALRLVDRLRRRKDNSGNDLYFLDLAILDIQKFCPSIASEAHLLRQHFYNHLPDPLGLGDLFIYVETPRDGKKQVWVKIRQGEFLMGSPESAPKRDLRPFPTERPQHTVKISHDFWMMAVPVTNAQFHAFDPTRGSVSDELASRPATGISWYEAVAFCRWLESRGFVGARLPTEAEWEYACRAGSTGNFWNGDQLGDIHEVGWYNENSEWRARRVGEKPANSWGLYDVHGNVWEWCGDVGNYSCRFDAQPVIDPFEPPEPTWNLRDSRIHRGGSWAVGPRLLRSAVRGRGMACLQDWSLGFRACTSSLPAECVAPEKPLA